MSFGTGITDNLEILTNSQSLNFLLFFISVNVTGRFKVFLYFTSTTIKRSTSSFGLEYGF